MTTKKPSETKKSFIHYYNKDYTEHVYAGSSFCSCCGATYVTSQAMEKNHIKDLNKGHYGILLALDKVGEPTQQDNYKLQHIETKNGTITLITGHPPSDVSPEETETDEEGYLVNEEEYEE